jgi:hypothetical protein
LLDGGNDEQLLKSVGVIDMKNFDGVGFRRSDLFILSKYSFNGKYIFIVYFVLEYKEHMGILFKLNGKWITKTFYIETLPY